MTNSLLDFVILKSFMAYAHVSEAPPIKQVDWHPPLLGWIKCNIDGTTKGSLGYTIGDGLFMDHIGAFMGCFTSYFGITFALHAEFSATMIAIETAYHKGWHSLWLECDSKLVVDAFYSNYLVPGN